MQRLLYYTAYPFLWTLSKLPFPLLYFFSDFISFILFHFIRYRRNTVRENLKLAFPEKSLTQRKNIERKFYQHMVDMFLEMAKSLSISNKELKSRFRFTNLEELDNLRTSNKSILLACGHYASYEWINALQLYELDYRGFGVYKKIKNQHFDRLVKRIREKYNATAISSKEAVKIIAQNQKEGLLGMYAMIADQSPNLRSAKMWTYFMDHRVPVFMGLEVLARKYDMTVVYLHVEKIKRGRYLATFKTITEEASKEKPNAIIRTYFKELEDQIRKAPCYYLWSHKRWKHRNAVLPEKAIIF